MLTRFVSDSAWGAPEYIYPHDDTVNIKGLKLNVAGNLNTVFSPALQDLNDFSNNNYSIFFLTNKKTLSSFVEIKEPSLYSIENKYPCLLGTFIEDDLIKEDSLFLECVPLYNHANEFEINFRSFFNSCTSLSGGSILFYLLDPALTGVEVGFSINGEPAKFGFSDTIKATVNLSNSTSMEGAAAAVTSEIESLNFCRFLSSSDINEYGVNQTFTLIISSNDGSPLSGETIRGYSFVLGNTELGYLSGGIKNLDLRRFAFSLYVSSYSPLLPPGYGGDEDNYVILPRLVDENSTPFQKNDNTETITRVLTGIFDPTKTGNDYYPSSEYFGLESYTYTQSSIQLNIFNRLSGYPAVKPFTFNGYNTNYNDFRIDITREGVSAGFKLAFGRKLASTETEISLPKFYTATNTSFSVSSISILELNQSTNSLLYSYKPNFVNLFGNNNRVFLDFNIVDEKQVYITHTLYKRKAYLVSDDLNKELFFIDSSNIDDTNLQIALFNYIYDPQRKKLILYRNIGGNIYALGVSGNDLVYELIYDLNNIGIETIFNLFSFKDIKTLFEKNGWVSYTQTPNPNNLAVNPSRSFNIDNNYLVHAEYSNSDSNLHINFFPLKNQLNEFDLQNRVGEGVDFRDYHSLYTGDSNERGSTSISLGYIAKTKEYIFKSGNITWFHMPYNENFKRIGINEANFVKNGATPGGSPIFSDKIWKKIGSYKYTSNLGDSKVEQTGQWLCSWLSGGNTGEGAIWMDRFYNPDLLTAVEAIKVTNNNEYIPSYTAKNYAKGITDRPSTLTLEPGVWYAYNHVGKNDAKPVIDFIKKDIIQEGLVDFGISDSETYKFTGKQSGYISVKNYSTPSNVFTLSFFGYSDDWNKPLGNQVLGNYLDTGFGIFNFQEINPTTYYFKDNTLLAYSVENKKIFSLTLPSNIDSNIFGLFRRNFYENFHVITDAYEILEYTIDGTLVDFVSPEELFPGSSPDNLKAVLSVANNANRGVILFTDLSYSIIDLRTNIIKHFPGPTGLVAVNFEESTPETELTVYIDSNDNIYLVNGRHPVLRQNKLYFIKYSESRKVFAFDIVDRTVSEYVDTSTLESLPLSPSITLTFANEDQIISEQPVYRNFNLAALSGMGLTLNPPNDQQYPIGFSIYRDPYIIEGATRTAENTPGNSILVDLNGNYWSNSDQTSRDELAEIYNSDQLGWSTDINESGLVLISDPVYREEYASTQTYGKIFAFNIRDQKLQPVGSIDLGPKPQIYDLLFEARPISTVSFSELISSFPLSSSIIFSNGNEIFDTEFGNSPTLRPYVSAISLAFSVGGSLPVHLDESIFNKVTYNFTQPLTSTTLIITQLLSAFNSNIIPNPFPTTGFVALSTFFDFTITELTDSTFKIRAKNRNKSAGPAQTPIIFDSFNEYTSFGLTYSAINIKQGLSATGNPGQEFGWKIQSASLVDTTNNLALDNLFVSSPGWGNSTGKVTLYKNVAFDEINSETTVFTAIDIINPSGIGSTRFGESFDTLFIDRFSEGSDRATQGFIVGAPGQTVIPVASAFYYELARSDNPYKPTQVLTGQTSAGWGFKVGMGKFFAAVSAPLSSSSFNGFKEGGISIFGIDPNQRESDGIIQYTAHLSPPPDSSRYNFGHSFDIEENLFAVASLSGDEGGYGGVTIDIFKRDSFNIETYTRFNLLSTLSFPFINNESNIYELLSSVKIDVKFYKDYLAVGAWRGDEEVFGDEHNKIVVWEVNKNQFYKVYDYSDRNTDPTIFKTYIGKSAAMALDRLITGTLFVYNTGNSLAYVVSAINTAVEKQTNGLFKGTANYIDNNNFSTTITTLISATDKLPPVLYTGVPAVTTLNVLKIQDYFPGSQLFYSGDILSYAFDLNEETKIFTDYNRIKTFDVLGQFKTTLFLNDFGMPDTLSGVRYGLSNIYNTGRVQENSSILAIDSTRQVYKVNFNEISQKLSYEIIDLNAGDINIFLPVNPNFNNITRQTFDITNCGFSESIIRSQDAAPSLTFKIRLNNRLDYEDALIFEPAYFTENLNKGWHHFAVVFDSVNGTYTGYVDTRQIFNYVFNPGKYTYSQILKNNILVGTVPFYNGVPYNNYYKSSEPFFNVTNLTLEGIKFYNRALHSEEIKFLSYDKFEPKDLRFQLEYGERNYVETIDGVARQKVPGRKSQFINVVINDSLITDLELQKYYETKILSELRDYLPSYVKINKIVWNDNRIIRSEIKQEDINIGNTLTNSGGIQ